MRLCLAKKDFIRTQIISKKISVKFFEEKDTHDLKLKFYKYIDRFLAGTLFLKTRFCL